MLVGICNWIADVSQDKLVLFFQPEFPGARAWFLHYGFITDRKSRSVLRPVPRNISQCLSADRQDAGHIVPTDCSFSGPGERGA